MELIGGKDRFGRAGSGTGMRSGGCARLTRVADVALSGRASEVDSNRASGAASEKDRTTETHAVRRRAFTGYSPKPTSLRIPKYLATQAIDSSPVFALGPDSDMLSSKANQEGAVK